MHHVYIVRRRGHRQRLFWQQARSIFIPTRLLPGYSSRRQRERDRMWMHAVQNTGLRLGCFLTSRENPALGSRVKLQVRTMHIEHRCLTSNVHRPPAPDAPSRHKPSNSGRELRRVRLLQPLQTHAGMLGDSGRGLRAGGCLRLPCRCFVWFLCFLYSLLRTACFAQYFAAKTKTAAAKTGPAD